MALPHRTSSYNDPAFSYYLSSSFDEVAPDELSSLRSLGANLLLIGLKGAGRDRFVASLVQGPVTTWEPGEPLVLPASGTLVLHEAGALTHDNQVRLLLWMERNLGRTRVISTTSASLFAQVEAGRFIDTLYYRLNTVSLHVA